MEYGYPIRYPIPVREFCEVSAYHSCRPSLTLDPLHELQKMDGDNGEERTWQEWHPCRRGKVATVAPPSDESPDRDS